MPQPCSLPAPGHARQPWYHCQHDGMGMPEELRVQPHLRWDLTTTTMFENLSQRLPTVHSLSSDLKHFSVHGYTSSPDPPIRTCPEMLPQGLRGGGRSAELSRGAVAVPWRALGAQNTGSNQSGLGSCWWLWQWEGAHLSGTGTLSDLGDWISGIRIAQPWKSKPQEGSLTTRLCFISRRNRSHEAKELWAAP